MGEDMVGVDFSIAGSPHPNLPHEGGGGVNGCRAGKCGKGKDFGGTSEDCFVRKKPPFFPNSLWERVR
jgi:hypothetical protein